MSVDFKLPMPAAAASMPGAANGGTRKAQADAGQFGALLAAAGQRPEADAEAGIEADAEAPHPGADWKARKSLWSPREVKEIRLPEAADEAEPGSEETDPRAVIVPVQPVIVDPKAQAAERGAAEAAAAQPQAAHTSAADQQRGRRAPDASGREAPASDRKSSATPGANVAASSAPSPAETPAGARAAAMSLAEAAPQAPRDPAADGPRQAAEGAVDRAALNRDAAPRDRADAKVTVVSSQVTVAPAAPAPAVSISSTGTAFVASMVSESALPQYVSDTAAATASAEPRPVTTLKIQLHPAELGMVNVKLSAAGEQLAVEVQVETSEARHRLATDSDAIVKALRGMGYDIDRITVQQAPSTQPSPGGGTNRENTFTPQEGRSGERQGQQARQQTDQANDQHARNGAVPGGDRSQALGGGVYI